MATLSMALSRRIVGSGTPDVVWQKWLDTQPVSAIVLPELVPAGQRAIIVAPHPDDETLGCGGLLQLLANYHRETTLIAATDGTASHPGSRLWPAERLARIRPDETRNALRLLDLHEITVIRAGISDGTVSRHVKKLAAVIEAQVRPRDVIFCPWKCDGHPDHEACALAAIAALRNTSARLVEFPIWMWHWAIPGDPRIPWHRAGRLQLEKNLIERKRAAVNCYRSQIEADFSTGREPILSPNVLRRLLHAQEFYFI
ncbi:MAG: PIG-L family deacetylase [Collimonas pratensis]|uniref:PIG-L deacetylase family protein n=1 Tax=Collimonas pratensis TaxID=279113 RepID=UPI003C7068C9